MQTVKIKIVLKLDNEEFVSDYVENTLIRRIKKELNAAFAEVGTADFIKGISYEQKVDL